MKVYQTTVREGEYLGPVDWSYDFKQFDWKEHSGGANPEHSQQRYEQFKKLWEGLERGEEWEVTNDTGWPRCGWKKVQLIGMYDGWPFWRPVPHVAVSGYFGYEWYSWLSISDIRKKGDA